jgi:predicted ATPase
MAVSSAEGTLPGTHTPETAPHGQWRRCARVWSPIELREQRWQSQSLCSQATGKVARLRAAMSLARLWQPQGKVKEARQMLAEIYGWFTEGFDTKDLQEAKALLEALT